MLAQRMTKYMAPRMYQEMMKQVEGSPLLPRDVMTMMLYNRLYAFVLPSGRILWPMPAYYDVSETLDVITNTPGETIVRGVDGWEPVASPGPQLATRWNVLQDVTIAAATPSVIATNAGPWNEFLILALGVTASVTGLRSVNLSTDNGASFYTTPGNYLLITDTGTSSASGGANLHNTNATAARYGMMHITGNNSGAPPILACVNTGSQPRLFVASPLPINAIRVNNNLGGNLTGGRVVILGR